MDKLIRFVEKCIDLTKKRELTKENLDALAKMIAEEGIKFEEEIEGMNKYNPVFVLKCVRKIKKIVNESLAMINLMESRLSIGDYGFVLKGLLKTRKILNKLNSTYTRCCRKLRKAA